MKRALLLFIIIGLGCDSFSQAGMWTWISGDTSKPTRSYVHRGTPSDSTVPVPMYESCRWTGKDGKFWIMNDGYLCMYDPDINLWTWMNGTGRKSPVYGVKGVSAPTNDPGWRQLGCPQWTDTSGNLWFFGGFTNLTGGMPLMADMWKYDVVTNEWTWMSGSKDPNSYGMYGVKGVPSVNNFPASRAETTLSWVDKKTNTLWLYGGQSSVADEQNMYYLNDMWRYDIASNQWNWMTGDSVPHTTLSPVYGTKGQPAPANDPGARMTYASWTDSSGNFWMLGGWILFYTTYPDIDFDYRMDMWMYNPNTNWWAWMQGSDQPNTEGFSLDGCKFLDDNWPAAAPENKSCWTDRGGRFWTLTNTLWVFDPAANMWNVTKGNYNDSTLFLHLGAKGVPSEDNWPGDLSGANTWTDKSGDFWLFSSAGSGAIMWRYQLDAACVGQAGCHLAAPSVTADKNIFCSSDSAKICAPAGYSSYQWNNGKTTRCMFTNQAGNYYVTVTDNSGCSAASQAIPVSVHPVPSITIVVQGDTLSSFGAAAYQWYLNGSKINGATNAVYVANEPGSYTLEIVDANGCTAMSAPVLISGLNEMGNEMASIYPNPSVGGYQLSVTNGLVGSNLEMYEANGQLVFQSAIRGPQSAINLPFSSGVYFIRIQSEKTSITRKWVHL